jgi:hypothetical protein
MTKQEQFLWIVQTTILANGINLAAQPDLAEEYRDEYSGIGAKTLMAAAIDVSERIPDNKTAAEAADEFCIWMIRHFREIQEQAGAKPSVPDWFAR